ARRERALAGPRPPEPGRLRLAPDPCPLRFCGAGLRSLWRGLYRSLAPLAVAHREAAAGPVGPDSGRNLPGRCGRHPVGAEGGWWMIGGALQDQGSRLPLIVADITIEPTFADGLPLFQRSSCAYQIKSMTYTGDGVDAALPLTASRCAILVVSKHKLKERAS